MDHLTQRASEQNTPPPNELDVWCDVAGVRKGRIYGLGMESTVLNRNYRGSSSSSTEWVRRQEFEQLQNQNIELQARLERVENTERRLFQMLERLQPQIPNMDQAESGSESSQSEDDQHGC